jgi:FSR family fosmidomycin resistance protein-like MFS transporter
MPESCPNPLNPRLDAVVEVPARPAVGLPMSSARATDAAILYALSFCHMLNDTIQALLPAIYPLLKVSFALTFTQIGLITLTFQMVGSVLQPVIGFCTDRRPQPRSLAIGMGVTLTGLILLAFAPGYAVVLLAAGLIGLGSAVFHPESSRIARLAAGVRPGFAQALFQVGGNAGTALGPLLAAWVVVPHGRRSILWFSGLALAGIFILARVGAWYRGHLKAKGPRAAGSHRTAFSVTRGRMALALGVLLVLMFSKFFYLASMTNYYTFFLMHRFGVSVQASQLLLFAFLFAGAVGTLAGGVVGDRFGRKLVIWFSVLGIAPFALILPHVGLFWTTALSMVIGFVMASAFPAILVYATELLPGRVGLIAGLFFGLAFGLAGIGSAVLGKVADATSIEFVMQACAFLPLLGVLTWFLPDLVAVSRDQAEQTSLPANPTSPP